MSEFAFSGVGINPHHGTAIAPPPRRRSTPPPRHPRRSRSGGAVSGGRRRLPGRRSAPTPAGLDCASRRFRPLQGLSGSRAPRGWCSTDGCGDPAVDHAGHRLRDHDERARCAHRARCWLRHANAQTALRCGMRRADHADARRTGRPIIATFRHARHAQCRRAHQSRCRSSFRLATLNAAGGFLPAPSWAAPAGCWQPRPTNFRASPLPPAEMSAADYIEASTWRARDWIARTEARHGRAIRLRTPWRRAPPSPPSPLAIARPSPATGPSSYRRRRAAARNPSAISSSVIDGLRSRCPATPWARCRSGLMVWGAQRCAAIAGALTPSLAIRRRSRSASAAARQPEHAHPPSSAPASSASPPALHLNLRPPAMRWSPIERRGSVAAETSFANAGVVAPGWLSRPGAAPGVCPRRCCA